LRAKIALAYPAVRHRAEGIWSSPDVRDLYPRYLITMHGITRSAVPLLEAAAERSRALAPGDAVAARLAPYFAHHAREETGHDRWVLEDIEAVGGDATEPGRVMPSAQVANLVGAQYYWLRHHHPVTLLGHMAVIEGGSPTPGFAARLQALTGYPEDCFRTIARHERIDIGHGRELFDLIDTLPLTQGHETMLGISAYHTISSIIDVLGEIRSSLPVKVPAPAE
jgi:hypothetical protein